MLSPDVIIWFYLWCNPLVFIGSVPYLIIVHLFLPTSLFLRPLGVYQFVPTQHPALTPLLIAPSSLQLCNTTFHFCSKNYSKKKKKKNHRRRRRHKNPPQERTSRPARLIPQLYVLQLYLTPSSHQVYRMKIVAVFLLCLPLCARIADAGFACCNRST